MSHSLPHINVDFAQDNCFVYLEKVPPGSVDLILVDPPYEISRDTGFKSVKNGVDRFAVSMDFGEWDRKFDGLGDFVELAYRALKPSGTLIDFYDLWKITILADLLRQSRFSQLRVIEWLKTNPVPLNSKTNYLTNAREIAIGAVKGSKPTFNSSYDKGVYEFPICHEKGRFHPTQKPLALIEALIDKHSNEGDTLLDCFSGSGTTAVASIHLNRHFKGCELNEEYYAKALARIKNESGKTVHLSEGGP